MKNLENQALQGTHRHKLFLNQGKIGPRGSYVKRSGRIYAVFGKAAGAKGFSGPITKLVLFMQPWEYEAPSLAFCAISGILEYWNINVIKINITSQHIYKQKILVILN